MQNKNSYPYKLATLDDRGGDPDKRWRINFYAWDVQKAKLTRRQKWISAKFKTKAQKIQEANRLIKGINRLLISGYHIDSAPLSKRSNSQILNITASFRYVIERKQADIRQSSRDKYEFILKNFITWIQDRRLDHLPASHLSEDQAADFFSSFATDHRLSPASHNTYLSYYKAIFNQLIKLDKISLNPARKIAFLKTDQQEDTIFTQDIKEQLLKAYPQKVQIMAQYMYYTFIRPGELRQLQVKHVRDKSIFVPGTISKNRKSSHVLITPALERLIQKLNVRKMPQDYYLISKHGIPGPKPCSKNTFTLTHLKIRRDLGIGDQYHFYCWKHTGVTDTYLATRDIDFINRQCRHSSLDMTKRYLRGLGLLLDYPLQAQLPDLLLSDGIGTRSPEPPESGSPADSPDPDDSAH